MIETGGGIDVVKMLADLGGLGLVAWLVYYVFKTLIPKIMSDFSGQLEKQRDGFERMLESQRVSHWEEMKLQRQDFRQELSSQRQEFKEELQRERQAVDKIVSLFRQK